MCALSGLLGGLEEQHHFAAVGMLFAEPLGQSAEDGGVSVVSAFVRDAWVLRAIGEVVGLGDVQRVDVAPDEDARAGLGAFVNGSQPVAANLLDDLVGPGLLHPFVQDPVGQLLLPRKLGVLM